MSTIAALPIPASPDGQWHYIVHGVTTSDGAVFSGMVHADTPLTAQAIHQLAQNYHIAVTGVTLLCAPTESRWAR